MKSVGKMYKLFPSRLDNFLDAINWQRILPLRAPKYNKFWALRGIDLELKKGQRIGILGRNGAGKSTLLKLITGNLAPTEGEIHVNGQIQALMDTGAGFHPEFTGYENVRASLTYLGLSPAQMDEALEDIIDFTELDEFMGQPFKTYSAGMQARLSFATATSIKPDILIIDEVLGAGDGYFLAKSGERIVQLVERNDATVLLVSHSMDQIVRFCDEAIWLDRGRVVQRGPALEVTKAYDQHLRVLNERRLKAKNLLNRSGNTSIGLIGYYNTSLLCHFIVRGGVGARCDVSVATLRENQEALETLYIGDAQDTDPQCAAYLQLDDQSQWSEPKECDQHRYRSVCVESANGREARGSAVFYLYALHDEMNYSFEVTYRSVDADTVTLEIWRDGSILHKEALPDASDGWTTSSIGLECSEKTEDKSSEDIPTGRAVRRWPSEGSLLIKEVSVWNESNEARSVFTAGESMTVRVDIEARTDGTFPLRPTLSMYRLDGILVTHLIGEVPMIMRVKKGEQYCLRLDIESLNLGMGTYIFSIAIFGEMIIESQRYDLIDRAYEFEVVTDEPQLQGAIFHHPGAWSLDCALEPQPSTENPHADS